MTSVEYPSDEAIFEYRQQQIEADDAMLASLIESASGRFTGIGEQIIKEAGYVQSSYTGRPYPRRSLKLLDSVFWMMNVQNQVDWNAQPVAAELTNMIIKASDLPVRMEDQRYSHEGSFFGTAYRCSQAELIFNHLLNFINDPELEESGYWNRYRMATVYRDNERPVALEKGRGSGVRSALTLTGVRLGGVFLPPGMLVNIEPARQEEESMPTTSDLNGLTCETRTIKNLGMTPLRATPWAYDDNLLARATFAYGISGKGQPKINQQLMDIYVGRGLKDYKAAADRVIEVSES